jgi:3-hydroxyacyl-[acyl-carrier-protein] dehydratase
MSSGSEQQAGQSREQSEAALRESLKRCSGATLDAALEFRKTGDTELLPVVVMGIIERFLEPDEKPKLHDAGDDLRIIEDLGVDSLTMMEVVILVEEVVGVSISTDELQSLRTVGDIKIFIDHKVKGLPPPQASVFLPVEQIAGLMPHQPPFLFLQEATISSSWAAGKYKISGSEFFLEGHFKDNPVFPASILLEALGQLAVLYLLKASGGDLEKPVDPASIYFTGCESVRCHRVCKPGDVLKLSVKPKRFRMPLASFEGSIQVGQEKAAFVEEISLTYNYLAEGKGEASPVQKEEEPKTVETGVPQ